MNPDRDNIGNYSIWGVVVTEVEVDILTGETRVVRVDLLEDAGLSTSPQVDSSIRYQAKAIFSNSCYIISFFYLSGRYPLKPKI